MGKYKYLLVSEGPTDIKFITQLAKKIGNSVGADVEIAELSPQKDATSGPYPPHGWGGVRRWCQNWKVKTEDDLSKINPAFKELAIRRNWKSIVSSSSANGLIIQMDADIAEQIGGLDKDFLNSSKTRIEYCKSAILFWLGEKDGQLGMPYLLISSYALETWMLATHPPTHPVFDDLGNSFDYEEISDVEDRLISIGYAAENKKGVKRLKKKPDKYIEYADNVFEEFSNVSVRCAQAAAFHKFITEEIS